ncbi:MAG: hypothetical protein JO256_08650 [Alphaproteobacteria bacterium]|nr:hypothetical protein [Alphaproteobacteria bacterium]
MKRGRGVDFEHRFRASRWAEDLLFKFLAQDTGLVLVRFGLSEVKATDELDYDKAGHKEPDLIAIPRAKLSPAELRVLDTEGGDLSNCDRGRFSPAGDLAFVLNKALAAFEVEFSPYKAAEMKGRHWQPKTKEQWTKRQLKHANAPTAPNIWVKEEDLKRLTDWEEHFGVPVLVTHFFDQEAFAIPLHTLKLFAASLARNPARAVELQNTRGIFRKEQAYDRIDSQGAGERKIVYVTAPTVATKVGDITGVEVQASLGLSSSKKYVSQVCFRGGKLAITAEFLVLLQTLKGQ